MEIAINSLFVSHENPIFEGDSQFWDIVEYPKMGIYNTQQDGHWARASICVRYKYKVNVLHARWRQAVKEAVRSIKTNNGLTPKS